MIGTVINTLAILIGGLLGCMIHGKFPVRIQRLILQCIGLVTLFFGARSLVEGWFVDSTTAMEATGTMLVLFSLLIGGVFGEALQLDKLVDKLGMLLCRFDMEGTQKETSGGKSAKGRAAASRTNAIRQAKRAAKNPAAPIAPASTAGSENDERIRWWQISKLPDHPTMETRTGHRFADGFAWATLLCALNAMSFSGAIAAGMSDEPKELFIKAAIDAVIVLFLASIYGMGATFGAIPVLAVESLMVFVSSTWTERMTPTLIAHLTIIAAVMTIGAGINLCFGKKWRVINLLPALLISPLYGLIVNSAEKLIK